MFIIKYKMLNDKEIAFDLWRTRCRDIKKMTFSIKKLYFCTFI